MAEDYSKPYFGNPKITKQAEEYRKRIGGYLSPQQQEGLFSTLVDFTPVVGDIKAGAEAAQALKEGDYATAALAGAGLIPFIPPLSKLSSKVKFLSPKEIQKYDFSHGTTPEKASNILKTGEFDPSKGSKTYSYSQLGHDALYLAPSKSWWLDPEKAVQGAARAYPTVLKTDISTNAKIANIDSLSDLDKIAKQIGVKDGTTLIRSLGTEDYGKATGPEYKATLARLQAAGIDGMYFSKKFDNEEAWIKNLPAAEQLALFNKSVVTPKQPVTEVVNPSYSDPFGFTVK